MANLKHEIRNADARDASLARVRRAPEKVSVLSRPCRRCRDGQNICSLHDL
jgi:hypothetical protein